VTFGKSKTGKVELGRNKRTREDAASIVKGVKNELTESKKYPKNRENQNDALNESWIT
jgi:hypothetical protein